MITDDYCAAFIKALVREMGTVSDGEGPDMIFIPEIEDVRRAFVTLANPTPTEASGSRSIPSSEPDAAMCREAEAQVLREYDDENPDGRNFDEALFDMCRKDDYAGIYKRMKEKIEQRARELAGKVKT